MMPQHGVCGMSGWGCGLMCRNRTTQSDHNRTKHKRLAIHRPQTGDTSAKNWRWRSRRAQGRSVSLKVARCRSIVLVHLGEDRFELCYRAPHMLGVLLLFLERLGHDVDELGIGPDRGLKPAQSSP